MASRDMKDENIIKIPQKLIEAEIRSLRKCIVDLEPETTPYTHTWGQIAAFERLLRVWSEKSNEENPLSGLGLPGID